MGNSQLRNPRNTPARRLTDGPEFSRRARAAPQTSVAVFDDLLVIVGGGTVDFDLLREL